ncbi:N-formylglutamate amidohydrolase [Luteimonas sp. RD2P54]|uniref:N-formylglutamate amidohydrolase n=1 Tax=Luteimonas endophytica TaxID=3042023 RepID=A0ABT6JA85_9GAMM|nr:N-formylglutamate amidohydrolase [Luteimonas endophytica]MDH5823736.1 N-formylglutamate amidohydrolase [Luteimonas endophytica]
MDDVHDAARGHFTLSPRLTEIDPSPHWDLVLGEGPILAVALHDGHAMRESLRPHLAFDDAQLRRDEDPLTGLFTDVGDSRLCVRTSRFEVDLNRPREKALSADPEDTWGLRIWRGPLPREELERSLAIYDAFYATVHALVEQLLARWGCALLLDIHSYNHRRDGADLPPAPQEGNPDIELGVTTADHARWGAVLARLGDVLRASPVAGRPPDVRENVRYPTGGHFPESLYARFGERLCVISPEFKKIYMDEWTGQADLSVLDDLRAGWRRAVAEVRPEFLACR